MVDATPSETPMPAQPVATVTNPAAPFPPAVSPPDFVPPPVTDPVSNLDFPPVDDAFALEMRSESIEQLVGGDALRRGVSERIEAGRSQTNADLVAGRDRVRVHSTLHEHTGHAFAEQAAHLHATVDGALGVHVGSEDTVLLAGHMSDLWDSGAAIVAAMTDDTVAGGGIRVTTLLDLWVHGLMGVEERIGTCTADTLLMESSATHYEREYGPGVHAAGLAVYSGSLYQSSRSAFRALMRVSSGVRNLIAGGGGRGGGGDAGAGDAPGASPPPVPTETGASEESATATLAAGRGAVEAPATAPDAADGLIGARRVSLEELVNSVDARTAEEMGEAGAVMRAEDLPELTRSSDTAERLGALRETLRLDAAASGNGTAGGSRAPKLDGAGSMHPSSGGGGTLEIDPPSAVYGENAPMVRPHPGNPRGEGSDIRLGLPGGADRPPRSAAQAPDFLPVYRRLREIRSRYRKLSQTVIARDARRAMDRIAQKIEVQFKRFGGKPDDLPVRPSEFTQTEYAYLALQKTARRADREDDPMRTGAIREALEAIDKWAVEELEALYRKYNIAEARPTQMFQLPPVTAKPIETVAAIPPPSRTPMLVDWVSAYRQLRNLSRGFSDTDRNVVTADFHRSADRISGYVRRSFRKFGGDSKLLHSRSSGATKTERAYRAMEEMYCRAKKTGEVMRACEIRQALELINEVTSEAVDELTTAYGALDALSILDIRAMKLPPPKVGPTTSAALPVTVRPPARVPPTTVPPLRRLDIPVPAHPIALAVNPTLPEPAGGLVQVTGVPGPPPASGLPGPSLAEAAGAQTGDLGRWWLDPPASGATATEPAAAETIVTPSLGETSSFWLQPIDPLPAPGTVPFDSGVQHTGETVQPPPVTTTAPSRTAPALSPGASFPIPSWIDDDFAVERALLAGLLPPRFDASQLVVDASMLVEFGLAEFGLAEELAAGRLPFEAIDAWIAAYRAIDEGGNTLSIEYLHSLKESIESALRAAYPGRVDVEWLDLVRELELPRWRGEPAAPSAASATALPELDVTEIDRLLGTGEGASHSARPPPPSAPAHTGAGTVAPPPAADPWGIRPPGMGGGPHPVAFDPWSAPPGPGSPVVYPEAMRTPVLSTGAPPEWQGAETPGFARAASGAVELPFSRRVAIARRFGANDALLEAEATLRTGDADAFGRPATRWPEVLADLHWLNAIVQTNSAAAAAMVDFDWSAIEALVRILDAPTPSP